MFFANIERDSDHLNTQRKGHKDCFIFVLSCQFWNLKYCWQFLRGSGFELKTSETTWSFVSERPPSRWKNSQNDSTAVSSFKRSPCLQTTTNKAFVKTWNLMFCWEIYIEKKQNKKDTSWFDCDVTIHEIIILPSSKAKNWFRVTVHNPMNKDLLKVTNAIK